MGSKSRSRRESEYAHFSSSGKTPTTDERRAADAFRTMSRKDRVEINVGADADSSSQAEFVRNRNQQIRDRAGRPGAYTTGPADSSILGAPFGSDSDPGNIRNSRKRK